MTRPSPSDQTAKVAFGDRATDMVLRGIIAVVRLLPWNQRIATMGALVRRIIGPLAGYRRRAEDNLAGIFPDLTASDRRRIANGVLDNFGRTLIENYSHREFGQRVDRITVTGPGLDAMKQALAQGRPVLFVTGHFGNHEAPRQVLNAMGHQVGGLYRPMRNQKINAHYAKTMTDLSGPVFEQGRRGTIGFARHLKDGGIGTLLFDVRDPSGIALPFLGKPAWTATSAAELALKFNALVVPYFGIRQPNGIDFEAAFEAPIPHADPKVMLAEMTARLEARVRANPEQWFWVHRRWKGASAETQDA